MFTGLIQTTGRISGLSSAGRETRMRIQPIRKMSGLEHGESIAVNGVCLTVEEFSLDWFHVYASSQTMSVTNLGRLRPGDVVNLERALTLKDRLGGHLVSGHVDCQASVAQIEKAGQSTIFKLNFPGEFATQVVDKGSVTLDGISLTIIDCGPDHLKVNIIPSTMKDTTISGWKPGTMVNMETDIIAKYVQKFLSASTEKGSGKVSTGMDQEFLKQHGFW